MISLMDRIVFLPESPEFWNVPLGGTARGYRNNFPVSIQIPLRRVELAPKRALWSAAVGSCGKK
jgi:hypothetical protein